jgi:signal peptidase I
LEEQDSSVLKTLEEHGNEERQALGKSGKGKKSVGREIFEWVLTFVIAIALAMVIRTFLFEPIRVDGTSMVNTLQNNEFLFVTKLDYLIGDPSRFDIVICKYPDRTENFVKRLVGLPGDTVEIKGGYLYLNGELKPEDYIDNRPNYAFGPITLAEGEYFVLGDNRSNSNDSHVIGAISRDMIVGHARAVIWPLGEIRNVDTVPSDQ